MAGKHKIPEGPPMIQRGTSSYILIGQAKAIQYGNFSICVTQEKKKKKTTPGLETRVFPGTRCSASKEPKEE